MNSVLAISYVKQKKYDDARSKLIDGKGSMSSKIEGLVSLGAKESKKLTDDS